MPEEEKDISYEEIYDFLKVVLRKNNPLASNKEIDIDIKNIILLYLSSYIEDDM